MLMLTIKTKNHSLDEELPTHTMKDCPYVKLWSQGNDEQFTQSFDFVALKRVNEYLETICEQAEVSNSDIDRVVGDIELLFKTTCVDTFGYHKQKTCGEIKIISPGLIKKVEFREMFITKHADYTINTKRNHYKNILKSVSKDYKQNKSL